MIPFMINLGDKGVCSDKYDVFANERIIHNFLSVSEVVRDEIPPAELASGEFFSIDMVTEGSGIHCVEGKTIPCKVGDIYMISPLVRHGYFLSDSGGSMVVRRLIFRL